MQRCHHDQVASIEPALDPLTPGEHEASALDGVRASRDAREAGVSLGAAREAAGDLPEGLRRYPDRGMLGGVCAGLADYVGRDPLLVRILAAAAVAVGGIGVLAYVLAWTLIPAAPGSSRKRGSWGDWLRAALMVVAVLAVLVGMRVAGLAVGDWVVWALGFGLWGLALLWRSRPVWCWRGLARRRYCTASVSSTTWARRWAAC